MWWIFLSIDPGGRDRAGLVQPEQHEGAVVFPFLLFYEEGVDGILPLLFAAENLVLVFVQVRPARRNGGRGQEDRAQEKEQE